MAREIFAKMSGTLDGNRKIRKAGRNGREVFLWVMRQVAIRDSDGIIPIGDVTDFAYVADQLMCSEVEAREGFAAAVTASLLSVTGDSCAIVGWDDDWSRRAMSNGERQAKYREKRKGSKESHASDAGSVTEAPLLVTGNVTSNAVEESRVEESRGEKECAAKSPHAPAPLELVPTDPPPRDRAHEIADACCDVLNAAMGSRYRADADGTRKLALALSKARRTVDEVERVVADRVAAWKGDPKMEPYLRPSTILAPSNFAKYLDDLNSRAPETPRRPWEMVY